MFINIQFKIKIELTKIYLLKSVDRKFVNKVFDKLYKQKQMKYINQSTSHKYSIFIVWKIVFEFDESKCKEQVVIDIKKLNKIIVIDFYSMLL